MSTYDFVVTGQSYAGNSNDVRLKVDESADVIALDFATGVWRVAHDPQPQGGDALPVPGRDAEWGSVWPVAMSLLHGAVGKPVRIVTATIFCEPIAEWLADDLQVQAIAAAMRAVPDAPILWDHGQSDVIARTSRAGYLQAFRKLRRRVAAEIGASPKWIIALSTHHPTVYQDDAAEADIRSALIAAAADPGCCLGPDLDALRGEYRSPVGRSQHWSAAGQQAAGAAWCNAILHHCS